MRPTKHETLTGRKPIRVSEFDLPTKAQARQLDAWLNGHLESSALPKKNNIEERKRRNRARTRASRRSIRWQQEHREAYNARMRAYRKRRRLGEKGERVDVGGGG